MPVQRHRVMVVHTVCTVVVSMRRRHTGLTSDWSSDVCSSDLNGDLVAWEGAFLLYQYSVGVVVMDLDG